jgi:anti-sigma B factor antagonist
METFDVRGERVDQRVRVWVLGEVDIATAPRVAACLSAHAHGYTGPVELDLSEVGFIDSTGVHLLMKLKDQARREGWTLTIASSEPVRRIVSMLGLQDELLVPPRSELEVAPG